MGRKIPLPKRHFGVRDPLQQRDEREEKIRNKINHPPKNDEQEVSKSFMKFIKLKNDAMTGKTKSQLVKINDDFKSTNIDLDEIKRHANESDKKFMKRVNNIAHQRRLEAEFAVKYNVEIVRNQDTGEIRLKKRPKDMLQELVKKRDLKSTKNETPKTQEAVKVTSLEKLKLRKKTKKQSKSEEKKRVFEEFQHEKIQFGETVLAPPTLIVPKKAQKRETAARPGQRELLLSSMMPQLPSPVSIKPNKIFKGPVDKKGKRKNLPNSTRVVLETERRNAVELYRQLKKKQPISSKTDENR